MQYRPIFFLAVFRAYLPYKLPVLPPKYFVGPNCYVLRYARQIFSWVPNLHKRRISQPVLGFDITVRASAFTGAGVGINARLPDMALYTSPVYFSFRAKNDITRPQRKTSCSNGRGVFAISLRFPLENSAVQSLRGGIFGVKQHVYQGTALYGRFALPLIIRKHKGRRSLRLLFSPATSLPSRGQPFRLWSPLP